MPTRIRKGLMKTRNFFATEPQEATRNGGNSGTLLSSRMGNRREVSKRSPDTQKSDPRREGAVSHQGTPRSLQRGEGSRWKTSRKVEIVPPEIRSEGKVSGRECPRWNPHSAPAAFILFFSRREALNETKRLQSCLQRQCMPRKNCRKQRGSEWGISQRNSVESSCQGKAFSAWQERMRSLLAQCLSTGILASPKITVWQPRLSFGF